VSPPAKPGAYLYELIDAIVTGEFGSSTDIGAFIRDQQFNKA
jgi:hypothetical protein